MGLHQFSSCELLFLLVMLLFFFDEGLAILSIWRFFHNDWRWIAGIVHLLVIGTIRHVDSETTDSYNTYILWESMAWYTSPTLSLSVVGMCSGLPQVRYIIGLIERWSTFSQNMLNAGSLVLPQALQNDCRKAFVEEQTPNGFFACLLIYWLTLERGLLVDGVFG